MAAQQNRLLVLIEAVFMQLQIPTIGEINGPIPAAGFGIR